VTAVAGRPTLDSAVDRYRLRARLDTAIRGLPEPPPAPVVVVDLAAFDANAADLARRAAGTPIRVASKSLRVPTLISRALATPGFAGVLGYSLREALWLQRNGISADIVLGYPTTDLPALEALAADAEARAAITLMVDDPGQLDLVTLAVLLLDGDRVVDQVPTYRGTGNAW